MIPLAYTEFLRGREIVGNCDIPGTRPFSQKGKFLKRRQSL